MKRLLLYYDVLLSYRSWHVKGHRFKSTGGVAVAEFRYDSVYHDTRLFSSHHSRITVVSALNPSKQDVFMLCNITFAWSCRFAHMGLCFSCGWHMRPNFAMHGPHPSRAGEFITIPASWYAFEQHVQWLLIVVERLECFDSRPPHRIVTNVLKLFRVIWIAIVSTLIFKASTYESIIAFWGIRSFGQIHTSFTADKDDVWGMSYRSCSVVEVTGMAARGSALGSGWGCNTLTELKGAVCGMMSKQARRM